MSGCIFLPSNGCNTLGVIPPLWTTPEHLDCRSEVELQKWNSNVIVPSHLFLTHRDPEKSVVPFGDRGPSCPVSGAVSGKGLCATVNIPALVYTGFSGTAQRGVALEHGVFVHTGSNLPPKVLNFLFTHIFAA